MAGPGALRGRAAGAAVGSVTAGTGSRALELLRLTLACRGDMQFCTSRPAPVINL